MPNPVLKYKFSDKKSLINPIKDTEKGLRIEEIKQAKEVICEFMYPPAPLYYIFSEIFKQNFAASNKDNKLFMLDSLRKWQENLKSRLAHPIEITNKCQAAFHKVRDIKEILKDNFEVVVKNNLVGFYAKAQYVKPILDIFKIKEEDGFPFNLRSVAEKPENDIVFFYIENSVAFYTIPQYIPFTLDIFKIEGQHCLSANLKNLENIVKTLINEVFFTTDILPLFQTIITNFYVFILRLTSNRRFSYRAIKSMPDAPEGSLAEKLVIIRESMNKVYKFSLIEELADIKQVMSNIERFAQLLMQVKSCFNDELSVSEKDFFQAAHTKFNVIAIKLFWVLDSIERVIINLLINILQEYTLFSELLDQLKVLPLKDKVPTPDLKVGAELSIYRKNLLASPLTNEPHHYNKDTLLYKQVNFSIELRQSFLKLKEVAEELTRSRTVEKLKLTILNDMTDEPLNKNPSISEVKLPKLMQSFKKPSKL